MRLWPSRRDPETMLATDDLLVVEDRLRRNVQDVFSVHERQIRGGVVIFRGEFMGEPTRGLDVIVGRFRPLGYTPFVRRDPSSGTTVLQAWPVSDTVVPQRVAVNVLLFVLTCLTTVVAGSGAFLAFDPLRHPELLLGGVPFAVTLLSILGTHEFGHYFTARYYRAAVTLPYFIPAPPPFLFGTLGAVIKMKSPARDRNSLFDIAVAGPLAGLVIAITALWIGLAWSTVGRVSGGNQILFGDSLLMQFLVYLKFGPLPAGYDVFVHPVALAGWVGLFVTALNLFPVGQLDGGRIAYALFGRRHRLVGMATFAALIVLGAVTHSPNWFIWGALIFFLVGFHHSPPLDDITPLSPGRRLLGIVCLVLLVLLLPPVPVTIS
jgi:membrane-associated protease RseP (regulator of RpoE activity)